MWQFLKSLSINLQATGPALVLIVWTVCVAVVGLYGDGPVAKSALTTLLIGGLIILFGISRIPR